MTTSTSRLVKKVYSDDALGQPNALPFGHTSRPFVRSETTAILPEGSAPVPPRTFLSGIPQSFRDDLGGNGIPQSTQGDPDEQPEEIETKPWYSRMFEWMSENSTAILFGAIAVFVYGAIVQ
jgi:hypothetical protein